MRGTIKSVKLFFKRYITDYPGNGKLAAMLLLYLLISSFSPLVFGRLLDAVSSGNMKQLLSMLVAYLLVNICTQVIASIQNAYTNKVQQSRSTALKAKYTKLVLNMPWHLKSKMLDADIINRIEADCEAVANYSVSLSMSVLSIILNSIISLIFILSISRISSVISCSLIPFVFFINWIFKKKTEQYEKKAKKQRDITTSFHIDTIGNHMFIKIFKLENIYNMLYSNVLTENQMLNRSGVKLRNISELCKNIASSIINFAMFYVFANQILNKVLTIGNLISYNSYLNRLYGAVTQFSSLSINRIGVELSQTRLDELSETVVQFKQIEAKKQPLAGLSSIRLGNISFSFETGKPIIKDVSISFNTSFIYYIVGNNGSGKTTLMRIIYGLLPFSTGQMYYGETDAGSITASSIIDHIFYAPKDTFIMNAAINDNIDIKSKGYKLCDIENVCKMVRLHDDIMAFPDGYNTMLGQGGITLSNGQKQKLNIARALLGAYSAYLFDEPTSDLDDASERCVMSILRKLSEHAIVICISHREKGIDKNGDIFRINDGKITVYQSPPSA